MTNNVHSLAQPVPMLLWCPECGARHIDAEDLESHKVHACQHCGMLWQPALLPTHGAQFLPGCLDPDPEDEDEDEEGKGNVA